MLKWFSIIALLFQAAPAAADQDAFDANTVLRLDEWSIDADEAGRKMTVRLTNVGPKAFRMIDATVRFKNALGEGIGEFPLAPDLSATPGERITHAGGLTGLDRVLKMRPARVRASVQVTAVLYDDGTVERFT